MVSMPGSEFFWSLTDERENESVVVYVIFLTEGAFSDSIVTYQLLYRYLPFDRGIIYISVYSLGAWPLRDD